MFLRGCRCRNRGRETTMMKLKPCPFCGSAATSKVQVTQIGGNTDDVDFSIE